MNKLAILSAAVMLCASVSVSAEYTDGESEGHAYVDLGLPSLTLWATANLGAASPEAYGEYYAWAEIAPQAVNTYSWSTYKYAKGEQNKLTKYCNDETYGNDGFTDGKLVLELTDDAAHVNWGGKWVIPSNDQRRELASQCYWVWTDSYNSTGVAGYIVYKAKSDDDKGKSIYSGTTPSSSYSLADTHIFLPCAGYYKDGAAIYHGTSGRYWTTKVDPTDPSCIYSLSFSDLATGLSVTYRHTGASVRAVCQIICTLSLSANSDTYGSVTGGGSFTPNTSVTVTATPNDGYEFVKWSDGATEAVRTVKLVSDSVLTAMFRVPDYKDGSEEGHAYVDLGLTSGTRWAASNIGADDAQSCGSYYAWAETAPQAGNAYSWSAYKYAEGSYITLTKYCTKAEYGYNGYKDSKTVLELTDDAAHVNWGGSWTIPTTAQSTELSDECYWVWTDDYNLSGVKGFIVFKAKSDDDKGVKVYKGSAASASYTLADAHIFIPAAGYYRDGESASFGSYGDYWLSSVNEARPDIAIIMYFTEDNVVNTNFNRYCGLSVRPVLPKSSPSGFSESVADDKSEVRKMLKDGVVYIIRGDDVYSVSGSRVK